MRKLLIWLDDNLLFLLTGFLLAFIPLYPKIPLFDIIPGYIVRVRVEDFFVGGTLLVWLIQLWRRKVSFGPNPLAKPILAYLTVGVLSMLSAIFIIRTVPMESLHIGKMALHFFRRVEYFSLFFVFYSAVKSLKQVKIYLLILFFTISAITIYGYGQKYLYWPAFSTMNREFSKGWFLYLTQHARVLSTFGGHYDLAAYVMVGLLMLWSLFFTISQKLWRALIAVVIAGSFWLLILTVSRTSFLAYIAGVTILFFIFMFKNGIRWSAVRWTGVIVLSMTVMLLFGDLSDRFTKLLKLDQRFGGIKSLVLRPIGSPPKNQDIALLENNIEAVTSRSDYPPIPTKPSDVLTDIPDFVATLSASGSASIAAVPRTYSKSAMVYDLSTGIRLDALWPMAIAGFKRNPLLGSGYSTLNKTQVSEFTEAESTDNDFLRALGETGLLGFLTFGWILFTVVWVLWKSFIKIKDPVILGLVVGAMAGVFGLLVNAIYIDVFEASKVAFSFWALVGIVLGAAKFLPQEKYGFFYIPPIPDLKETMLWFGKTTVDVVKSHKTYLVLIAILALVVRHHKIHAPLADWHSWRQADTSAVTRNFVRYGIDPLYPRFDDLSSVASGQPNPEGYRFVEFPVYNIASVVIDRLFPGYSVEYSGRLTSIFFSIGSLLLLYKLTKKYFGTRVGLWSAFFFAIIPYNIFWSRVILPEPTLVCLTLGMLYFFDAWVTTSKKRFWVLSLVFATLALLVKFTAVFFLLPMAYVAWKRWGLKTLINPWIIAYGVLMLVPFGLWRLHIAQFPEGVPAYAWLFNGNNIRFKGAFFWWLFAERIAKMILGGWGIILFGLGLVVRPKDTKGQETYVFHFWLLAMAAYLAVFATGNVQHDYYQIILVPILCVFMALGAQFLWEARHGLNPWVSRALLGISIAFMLMFGWYQARDLFNINHPEIVEAGAALENLLGDKRGNVIAPYGGDTAFLYQTSRKGWPLMDGTIDQMLAKGAHFYVSTNYDPQTQEFLKIARDYERGLDIRPFKVLKQNDKFVILQLVPDRAMPTR